VNRYKNFSNVQPSFAGRGSHNPVKSGGRRLRTAFLSPIYTLPVGHASVAMMLETKLKLAAFVTALVLYGTILLAVVASVGAAAPMDGGGSGGESLHVEGSTDGDAFRATVSYDGPEHARVVVSSTVDDYPAAGRYTVTDERTLRLPVPAEPSTVRFRVSTDRVRLETGLTFSERCGAIVPTRAAYDYEPADRHGGHHDAAQQYADRDRVVDLGSRNDCERSERSQQANSERSGTEHTASERSQHDRAGSHHAAAEHDDGPRADEERSARTGGRHDRRGDDRSRTPRDRDGERDGSGPAVEDRYNETRWTALDGYERLHDRLRSTYERSYETALRTYERGHAAAWEGYGDARTVRNDTVAVVERAPEDARNDSRRVQEDLRRDVEQVRRDAEGAAGIVRDDVENDSERVRRDLFGDDEDDNESDPLTPPGTPSPPGTPGLPTPPTTPTPPEAPSPPELPTPPTTPTPPEAPSPPATPTPPEAPSPPATPTPPESPTLPEAPGGGDDGDDGESADVSADGDYHRDGTDLRIQVRASASGSGQGESVNVSRSASVSTDGSSTVSGPNAAPASLPEQYRRLLAAFPAG
jgi:hypothetical protein